MEHCNTPHFSIREFFFFEINIHVKNNKQLTNLSRLFIAFMRRVCKNSTRDKESLSTFIVVNSSKKNREINLSNEGTIIGMETDNWNGVSLKEGSGIHYQTSGCFNFK